MSFASWSFLLLVLGCLVIYGLLPQKLRWLALLAASMVFYAVGGGWTIVYLILVTLAAYLAGLRLSKLRGVECPEGTDKKEHQRRMKRRRHRIVGAVCVLFFGLLIVFKYLGFAVNTANELFGFHIEMPELAVPLGISFFIFQSLGYVIDVSRGKAEVERNILKFALFTSFFPQTVQGPIGRYGQLAPQLMAGEKLKAENMRNGIQLIMWGYFKKLVIADRAGPLVAAVFAGGDNHPGSVALAAVLLYSVQLYCDFSGGIDVSRGVAEMFGITMAENFRRPLFAVSLTDYWRRWHMSLGQWMRDYVFYPLSLSGPFTKLGRFGRKKIGGTVGKILPTTLATFIIYFLIGIWHGGNLTYIAFGLYNGVIITSSLLLEGTFRSWREKLRIKDEALWWKVFRMVRTSVIVVIGRYLTRAPWLKMSLIMLGNTFFNFDLAALTVGALPALGLTYFDLAVIVLGCAVVFIAELIQERGTGIREALSKKSTPVQFIAILIPLLVILLLGVMGRDHVGSSFIYAQF